jgi:Flp pilus assembly protein TadG
MAKPSLFERFGAKLFARDDNAAAAVEMAIVAPVALLFLSVVVAGGQSLTLYHRTVLTAHEVTDLVSRTPFAQDTLNNTQGAEDINESDLDTDLMLSQLIYYPNDTTNLKVVMSELYVTTSNGNVTGTVQWSEGCNGATPLAKGTTVTLNSSYGLINASYVLYGQVSNTYQPLGIELPMGPLNLSAVEVLTIRNAAQMFVNPDKKTC